MLQEVAVPEGNQPNHTIAETAPWRRSFLAELIESRVQGRWSAGAHHTSAGPDQQLHPVDQQRRQHPQGAGAEIRNPELGGDRSILAWKARAPMPWEVAQCHRPYHCSPRMDPWRRRVHPADVQQHWLQMVSDIQNGPLDRPYCQLDQK